MDNVIVNSSNTTTSEIKISGNNLEQIKYSPDMTGIITKLKRHQSRFIFWFILSFSSCLRMRRINGVLGIFGFSLLAVATPC